MKITEHGRAFVQSKEYELAVKTLVALNMDEAIYLYTAVSLCMDGNRSVATEDEALASFINGHKQEIKSVADAALNKGKVKKRNPNLGLWEEYVPLF